MALPPRDRPHFHVEGGSQSEAYTSPRLVITGLPPARIRADHAARLGIAIGTALAAGRQRIADREDGLAEGAKGFYLEFDFPVAERAAVEALENKPKSIELVAVRPVAEGDVTISATVFVPEAAADFLRPKDRGLSRRGDQDRQAEEPELGGADRGHTHRRRPIPLHR